MQDPIARWVYTKEEWRYFARWRAKDRGVLNYLWHILFRSNERTPVIEFTEDSIHIGKRQEVFKSPELEIRRVDINEKGNMNILQITYENATANKQVKEIHLPIPRGKLREAIDLQRRLTGM